MAEAPAEPKEGMEFICEFPPREPTEPEALAAKVVKPASAVQTQVLPRNQSEVKPDAAIQKTVSPMQQGDHEEEEEGQKIAVEAVAPSPPLFPHPESQSVPLPHTPSLYDETIPPPKDVTHTSDKERDTAMPPLQTEPAKQPQLIGDSPNIQLQPAGAFPTGQAKANETEMESEGTAEEEMKMERGTDLEQEKGPQLNEWPSQQPNVLMSVRKEVEEAEPMEEAQIPKPTAETGSTGLISEDTPAVPQVPQTLPESPTVQRIAETGEEESVRGGTEADKWPPAEVEVPPKDVPAVEEAAREEEGQGKEEEGEILSSSPVPEPAVAEKPEKKEKATLERYV